MNQLVGEGWPIFEAYIERLGWGLVHAWWQFSLAALIAAIGMQMMRRKSAAARYGVLVAALLMSVVLPAMTWIWQGERADQPADYRIHKVAVSDRPSASESESSSTRGIVANEASEAAPRADLSASPLLASTSLATRPALSRFERSWWKQVTLSLQPWLAWIVIGWSLGVLLCSLRPLLGWHNLWRLRRFGVSPVSSDVSETMQRLARRLGVLRSVQVLHSTLAQTPVVIGYMRPVILLPLSLMTTIPVSQLEAILAHELSHIRRHDFIVNLFQTLIETMFFYHPAVWWLSRQIRIEREHCCDDVVVALLGNRVEYGRALLAVEEFRGQHAVLALGVADGSLLSRIRRIVGSSPKQPGLQAWSMLGLIWFSVGGVFATAILNACWWTDDSRESPARPYLVKLADGTSVELLGVASDGTDPARWWKPNGEVLDESPLPNSRINSYQPWDINERRFAVRSTGTERTLWFFPGDGQFSSRFDLPQPPDMILVEDIRPSRFATLEPTTLSAALGEGQFGPWVAIDRAGRERQNAILPPALAGHYAALVPLGVEHADNKTILNLQELSIHDTRLAANRQWVSVAKDRRRSPAIDVNYCQRPARIRFDMPVAEIDHFEFRVRPHRYWVTFENVALQQGQPTTVKITVRSPPQPKVDRDLAELPNGRPDAKALEPSLSNEILLDLNRAAAHDGRWFFIDLDRGRLTKPPFRVDLSHKTFPFQVLSPTEAQLKGWLTENGVDLMLFVDPQRFEDGSGRWHQTIETRSISTKLGHVNGLLSIPHVEGQSWTWKNRPGDVITPFARKDEATHVSGFAGSSSGFSLRPDSPDLRAFRTAENVVGFYLLEHNDLTQDSVTLRIIHASNVKTPLEDILVGERFVDGKQGAASPPAR